MHIHVMYIMYTLLKIPFSIPMQCIYVFEELYICMCLSIVMSPATRRKDVSQKEEKAKQKTKPEQTRNTNQKK